MSEFLIPYQTLQVGHEIFFTLYPDAPKFSLRSGVVCSIQVQVGTLLDGTTSVQTLLGILPLPAWLDGAAPKASEWIPLEFMESVSIESYHPKEYVDPDIAAFVEEVEGLDIADSPIVTLDDVYQLHERKRPEAKAKIASKAPKKEKKAAPPKAKPVTLGLRRRR